MTTNIKKVLKPSIPSYSVTKMYYPRTDFRKMSLAVSVSLTTQYTMGQSNGNSVIYYYPSLRDRKRQ